VMLATMTVREVIFMSAKLRLPTAMSEQEKRARVVDVIKILHLTRCADTVIGNAGDLRGGEEADCDCHGANHRPEHPVSR